MLMDIVLFCCSYGGGGL